MNLLKYSFIFLIIAFDVSHGSIEDYAQCGKTSFSGGLIFNGAEATHGQWPWHAPMVSQRKNRYFCGSTLISKRHVLTAAHCLKYNQRSSVISLSSFKLLFGGFDITNISEWTIRNASKITIHPEWRNNETKFDADLAVIELDQQIMFSKNIRKICLPEYSELDLLKTGSVIGYGKMENDQISDVLRVIEITTTSTYDCVLEHHDYAEFMSKRMFCAGSQGRVACSGDSGSGFFVKEDCSPWIIFGIVSSTFIVDNRCNSNKPSAFTSVPVFMRWIHDSIENLERDNQLPGECSNTESSNNPVFQSTIEQLSYEELNPIGKEDESVTLKCRAIGNPRPTITWTHNGVKVKAESGRFVLPSNGVFKVLNLKMSDAGKYICSADNGVGGKVTREFSLTVHHVVRGLKGKKLLEYLGEWRNFKTFQPFKNTTIDTKTYEIASNRDGEITAIKAVGITSISYLPIEVGQVFPNLVYYTIKLCSVTEISKENFKSLGKLQQLILRGNKITSIEKDAFHDLKGLKVLDLGENQITFLHEETFKNNKVLQQIWLNLNKLESLPPTLMQNLSELKEFDLGENNLRTLDTKFFEQNLKMEVLWLYSNQIEYLSADIFTGINKLEYADLRGNKCISKKYGRAFGKTYEDLSKISSDLTQSCSQGSVRKEKEEEFFLSSILNIFKFK